MSFRGRRRWDCLLRQDKTKGRINCLSYLKVSYKEQESNFPCPLRFRVQYKSACAAFRKLHRPMIPFLPGGTAQQTQAFFYFSWTQFHLRLQFSPPLFILSFKQWNNLRRRVFSLHHAPSHVRQWAEQPPLATVLVAQEGHHLFELLVFVGFFPNENSWEEQDFCCASVFSAPPKSGGAEGHWKPILMQCMGCRKLSWGWVFAGWGGTAEVGVQHPQPCCICLWGSSGFLQSTSLFVNCLWNGIMPIKLVLAGRKVILAKRRQVNGRCISAILWILCNADCYHNKL